MPYSTTKIPLGYNVIDIDRYDNDYCIRKSIDSFVDIFLFGKYVKRKSTDSFVDIFFSKPQFYPLSKVANHIKPQGGKNTVYSIFLFGKHENTNLNTYNKYYIRCYL
ncbi:hypothetical protein HanPI659440_Chr15g0590811 [Helianthus annuus]|nr:hypothetical protein HanPI659440_Chr15g0590811 [Helianthus annuus]